MTYSVKELYYTLQGEGAQTGRAAAFLRFAGCNLWTGLERDRASAVCTFCDTDFVGTDGSGGGKFPSAEELAAAVGACWGSTLPLRVEKAAAFRPRMASAIWGGVSVLPETPSPRSLSRDGSKTDLDPPSRGGFETAHVRPYVVCTGGEPLLQLDEALIAALHARGFEVGVETNGTQPAPIGLDWICVSPKADAELVLKRGNELKLVYPQAEAPPERFAGLDFAHFFLQPMDNPARAENAASAIAYCLAHPQWRLSLQTHKFTGIP